MSWRLRFVIEFVFARCPLDELSRDVNARESGTLCLFVGTVVERTHRYNTNQFPNTSTNPDRFVRKSDESSKQQDAKKAGASDNNTMTLSRHLILITPACKGATVDDDVAAGLVPETLRSSGSCAGGPPLGKFPLCSRDTA